MSEKPIVNVSTQKAGGAVKAGDARALIETSPGNGFTNELETTLMDDTVVTMDDAGTLMGAGQALSGAPKLTIEVEKPRVR